MIICFHNYKKISNIPLRTYYDYSGYNVGIFKCQCTKCEKIKNRKFY